MPLAQRLLISRHTLYCNKMLIVGDQHYGIAQSNSKQGTKPTIARRMGTPLPESHQHAAYERERNIHKHQQ